MRRAITRPCNLKGERSWARKYSNPHCLQPQSLPFSLWERFLPASCGATQPRLLFAGAPAALQCIAAVPASAGFLMELPPAAVSRTPQDSNFRQNSGTKPCSSGCVCAFRLASTTGLACLIQQTTIPGKIARTGVPRRNNSIHARLSWQSRNFFLHQPMPTPA
jgi:hypothetical protein